ncbi:MAG: adenylate/guanylate cyclase, partial [Rhodopila sp.]|nr:adenylate/guanylate cyclase [Rhodopila sp.]
MASATIGQDLKGAVAERKHVTILFADIVNSTHLIRGFDAEQSVHLLDEVVAGMVAAVQTEEGRVLRLQGDGIKAVFGAPYAQENHAERACNAALEIHDFARRKKVRVRVGINSGEVVTRSVPLEQGPVYEAGGMAVHLAARIERFAAPGSTCLSETTARLVRCRFHVRQLKPRKAKGLVDVVQVFVLMRRMPSRSRWEARAAYGGVGRLVGRSSELTLLTGALADVATGHGTTFALVGPPGIGKSRLVFELLRDKIRSRWTCFRMSAEATDVHTGLRPFANMLREWLRIGQQTARGDAWRDAERRLSELDGLRAEDLGALAALLDLTGMGNTGTMTGSDLRGAIIRAVRKLLHACAGRGPVILVAEDVHWLDTDSKDMLCAIMSSAEHVPMAVMVTYRSGHPTEPVQGLAKFRVDIPPLSEDQARDLLTSRLGSHRSLEALKRQIVERAGGTPLFLEAMAREVIDGGLLNRRDAGFELSGSRAALSLPPTINTLLSERLDRLPGRLKVLVRLVSVIGQEAPLPLVLQLLPPGHADVESDLSDLITAGVLLPSGPEEDRRVRFNHVLTQEAAYQAILKEDRRIMHHRVFRAYEDLYAERRDEHAEVLALHAQRAALWPEALRYLRLAAARAIQRSSHSSAIAHVNCALQIIASEHLIDYETELQLRLLLRTAYNAIGNYRQRLANLDRAQVLANITRHREIIPEVMISRASVLLQLGKPIEALRICE